MLEWPVGSERAQAFLLRPVQDLEVYIEDRTLRGFYRMLLQRLLRDSVRVLDVFPLNGKQSVLEKAANHQCIEPPALFIIDGDFEWVRGEPGPDSGLVCRLEAYSVENLLVEEAAVATVVFEEACVIDEDQAKARVEFDRYTSGLQSKLEPLLATWAAVNKLCPELTTVGAGVQKLINDRGGAWELNAEKIEAERQRLRTYAVSRCGEDVYSTVEEACRERLRGLSSWADALPGRQVLLPLLVNYIAGCSGRRGLRIDSLRLRLARHSDHPSLQVLRDKALARANGQAGTHNLT